MLRLILSRTGHRALLAANLDEARKIWASYGSQIELVITDNSLPDGSGVEFAARLAREKPDLKVIVASGLPTEVPANFRRVDKPFNMSTLLHAINELLPNTSR